MRKSSICFTRYTLKHLMNRSGAQIPSRKKPTGRDKQHKEKRREHRSLVEKTLLEEINNIKKNAGTKA